MTFLTTFIPIVKLYDSIIKLYSISGENIKKILGFLIFLSFLQNLTDLSLFQENYEYIFEFYRKRAFIWYKNISSSTIFSQHHERIQIFNEDVKVYDNFTLIGSRVQKRSLNQSSPDFSLISRYNWQKNHGEPLSAKMSTSIKETASSPLSKDYQCPITTHKRSDL